MGKKCMKKKGFTLLEVIISMVIIAIVSVGIYTGYIIMIRQTKDGQVKQATALEGKKVAEVLQSESFMIPGSSDLTVGGMTFEKDATDYKRYLNSSYKDTEDDGSKVTKDTAKYIESVTFAPAAATPVTNPTVTTSEAISLNTNNSLNSQANKIYISRIGSQDYISYWKYDKNNSYNPQTDDSKQNISLSGSSKVELSMYITPKDNDSSNQNIKVVDYTGKSLITAIKSIGENLVINFNNYKNSDGSLPSGENIEINVYNQTSAAANIYLEKQTDLNVDLGKRKGEVNLYNNRAENVNQDDIGILYDIKINITEKNNNNLFTGYYKKNLK